MDVCHLLAVDRGWDVASQYNPQIANCAVFENLVSQDSLKNISLSRGKCLSLYLLSHSNSFQNLFLFYFFGGIHL